MRAVVTGGAGLIGSHLADRLLSDGAEVSSSTNFDPYYPRAAKEANLSDALRAPRCRLFKLDIRDAAAAVDLVGRVRPDAIVHLAARAGERPNIEDSGRYADVNVTGTVRWLEAECRDDPRLRSIYASIASVYGDRPDAPFRATDPVELRHLIDTIGASPGKAPIVLRVPEQPGDVRLLRGYQPDRRAGLRPDDPACRRLGP